MEHYRFAFDLGTSSIGWAVFKVSDKIDNITEIIDCGSRIFSNSRDDSGGASLAVTRRLARQARRNNDRFVRRHNTLLRLLCENGLFPSDKESQERYKDENPYLLRAAVVQGKTTLYELGRAILHLNKRRGFKSSRKDPSDSEGGKLKDGIKKLEELLTMDDTKTLGEFFAKRQGLIADDSGNSTYPQSVLCRKKNPIQKTKEEKEEYDFYIDRKFVEKELQEIWQKQKEYYPHILTDELYESVHKIIFHQRNLLPQEIEKCTINPKEICAPRAIPSVQEYTLLLNLNNMRFITQNNKEYPLTLEQRDLLFQKISIEKEVSFTKIRKLLTLSSEIQIKYSNLQKDNDETKSKLPGCSTNCKLLEIFGKEEYNTLSLRQKDILTYILNDCVYEEQGIALLTKAVVLPTDLSSALSDTTIQNLLSAFTIFGTKKNPTSIITPEDTHSLPQFSEEKAQECLTIKLNPYYAKLSLSVISQLLPFLREDVIPYSKACELAGFHHSKLSQNNNTEETVDPITGEISKTSLLQPSLKYYGEIISNTVIGEWKKERSGSTYARLDNRQRHGFITNPSVHVALNQLRTVTNALIKQYGNPVSIAIELARELPLGPTGKQKLHDAMISNKNNNEKIKAEIQKTAGIEYPSSDDIVRVKLFEEAKKAFCGPALCVYSGKVIAFAALFSREIEIDHILYFSGSNDDSFANKILCYANENRNKSGNSPYEHYSANPEKWEAISLRAKKLPENKA
ncbi:MAG: type II CRISPR RNA-guided endonuclease Cas9 [Desulfovibrionaceae bacterium]